MARHLHTVADLAPDGLRAVMARAAEFEAGARPERTPLVCGSLFGETSLRTRVGFAAAAHRLGWSTIDVVERRHSPESMMESWPHTLRTLGGYLDVLVARTGTDPMRDVIGESFAGGYVNGGERGPDGEHPSQAAIDLFAVDRFVGLEAGLAIGIVGDSRMRAVRSLTRALEWFPPRVVAVFTDDRLWDPELEARLPSGVLERREPFEVEDLDVLYVAGIPHESVPLPVRDCLRVDRRWMALLPSESVVLSPLPTIDEIDDEAWRDPRLRAFEQSDLALPVRMAILEWSAF